MLFVEPYLFRHKILSRRLGPIQRFIGPRHQGSRGLTHAPLHHTQAQGNGEVAWRGRFLDLLANPFGQFFRRPQGAFG